MEKINAPLPAQPIEGAKSLVKFLYQKKTLNKIAGGDRTVILQAPIQEMVDSLGFPPSIATMVKLFKITIHWIDKQSGSYNQIATEHIGRNIQYLIEQLSKNVEVQIRHQKAVIPQDLTYPNGEIIVKHRIPAHTEIVTGKPLAKLIAIELQGKLSTIVQDTESRFARELAKRLQRLAAS